MRVLITGGCGYIGSHTCVRLLEAGHTPVIVDSLCNSTNLVLARINALCGVTPRFYKGDIRDRAFLDMAFAREKIDAVIHFAGLKAVGESVLRPLSYYDVNVGGTLRLLEAMSEAGVRQLIFSSSATVYGAPERVPVREDFPRYALNPYGQTKLTAENILLDLHKADPNWSITLLRYFNPVGAHPSGLIGESPQGVPNNLVPYLARVATGSLPYLKVFGGDYPTADGTGIRDYIHVMDLASGHIAALDHSRNKRGGHIFNLGTGRGVSVLEMIKAFSAACDRELPYKIVDRRPGDAAEVWSDPAKAAHELGWEARLGVSEMVSDTLLWQTRNPLGYE